MCQALSTTPAPALMHKSPLHLLIPLNGRCYPKLWCLLLIKCHLLRETLTNPLSKADFYMSFLVIFFCFIVFLFFITSYFVLILFLSICSPPTFFWLLFPTAILALGGWEKITLVLFTVSFRGPDTEQALNTFC